MASKIGPTLLKAFVGTTVAAGAAAYTKRDAIREKCDKIYKERSGPFTPAEGETFWHGTKIKGRKPWQPGEVREAPGEYFIGNKEAATTFAQDIGSNWKAQKTTGDKIDNSDAMLVEVRPEKFRKKFVTQVPYLEPGTKFTVVSIDYNVPPASDWQRKREAASRNTSESF